jgi:hypothetical protein
MTLTHLTDGDLADAMLDARNMIAAIEHEVSSREARRRIAAAEAYRDTCRANGLLYGFDLAVAERRANGHSLTAAQRKVIAMTRVDLAEVFG